MATTLNRVVTEYHIDTRKAAEGFRNLRKASADATKSLASIDATTRKGFGLIEQAINRASLAVKGFLSYQLSKSFIDISDAAVNTTAKLQAVSDRIEIVGTRLEKSRYIYEDLRTTANRYGIAVDALSASYIKLATAVPTEPHNQLNAALTTISKVLSTTGASVQQVNAVLLQMSQALGSGALQGDEFRAVIENAPVLIRAWREALGKADVGFRDLSSSAAFTTESFFRLLPVIEELSTNLIGTSEVPITISRGFQILRNEIITIVTDFNNLTKAFNNLGQVIVVVAKNLDLITIAAVGAAASMIKLSGVSVFAKLTLSITSLHTATLAAVSAFASLAAVIKTIAPVAVIAGFYALGKAISDQIDKARDFETYLLRVQTTITDLSKDTFNFEVGIFRETDLSVLQQAQQSMQSIQKEAKAIRDDLQKAFDEGAINPRFLDKFKKDLDDANIQLDNSGRLLALINQRIQEIQDNKGISNLAASLDDVRRELALQEEISRALTESDTSRAEALQETIERSRVYAEVLKESGLKAADLSKEEAELLNIQVDLIRRLEQLRDANNKAANASDRLTEASKKQKEEMNRLNELYDKLTGVTDSFAEKQFDLQELWETRGLSDSAFYKGLEEFGGYLPKNQAQLVEWSNTFSRVFKNAGTSSSAIARFRENFEAMVAAANKFDIPVEVLATVAQIESRFNNAAVSRDKNGNPIAFGFMQFIPETGQRTVEQLREMGYAVDDFKNVWSDASTSILLGAKHLSDLRNQFGSWTKALIAYNAGPGKVPLFEKFGLEGIPQETRNYLKQADGLLAALGESVDGLGDNLDDAGDKTDRFNKNIDGIRSSLDPVAAATQKYAEQVRQLAEAYEAYRITGGAAGIDLQEFQRLQQLALGQYDETIKKLGEADKANEKTKKSTKELGYEMKTLGELMLEAGKSAITNIQGALAEVFKRSITSAKDFGKALKDIIINAVANIASTLATQKFVVPIVAAITGMSITGGAAAGAAGNAAGGLGGGFNLGSLGGIGSLFAKLPSQLGLGIEKILFNTPWSDFGTQIATGLASTSMLNLIGGGLAGAFIGSSIFKKGFGQAGASFGAAAGSILGSIVPGIGNLIGGAIGGLLGGGIGSLFGGNKKTPRAYFDTGSEGSLRIVGGSGINGEAGAELNRAIDAINIQLNELGDALGQEAKDARARAGFGRTRVDAKNIDQFLQDYTASMIDTMIAAWEGTQSESIRGLLADVRQKAGGNPEQYLQGIQELFTTIESLGAVINQIQPGSLEGFDEMADAFAKLKDTGVLTEDLGAALDNLGKYMQSITPEAVRVAEATKIVEEGFQRIGIEVPKSREAFYEYVNSLDLTSANGISAAKELGLLAQAFEYLMQQADKTTNSIDGAASSLTDLTEFSDFRYSLRDEEDKVNRATKNLADVFKDLGVEMPTSADAMRDYLLSLDLNNNEHKEIAARLQAVMPWLQLYTDELKKQEEELQNQVDSFVDFRRGLAGPQEVFKRASDTLQKAFDELGVKLPTTYESMRKYLATLDPTNEEHRKIIAILSALIPELTAYTNELKAQEDAARDAAREMRRMRGDLRENLMDLIWPDGANRRKFEETMQDAFGYIPDSMRDILKMLNSGELTDEQIKILTENFNYIEAHYRDLQRLEEERIGRQEEAQRKAIQRQISSLQEYVSKIDSILSSLRSTRESIEGTIPGSDSLNYDRAVRGLRYFSNSGTLPDEEYAAFMQRSLGAGVYSSAQEERVAKARIAADLRRVEAEGEGRKSAAERQIERLEQMSNSIGQLREEMKVRDTVRNEQLKNLNARLSKFDNDGMPPERDAPDRVVTAIK